MNYIAGEKLIARLIAETQEVRGKASALRALAEKPKPEPKPQMMICERATECTCLYGGQPHKHSDVCDKPSPCGGHRAVRCIPVPKPGPESEKLYHCADCGVSLTAAEGGAVFTLCDECWKKQCPPRKPPTEQYHTPYCPFSFGECHDTTACNRCDYFTEAASDWARNQPTFTEHK